VNWLCYLNDDVVKKISWKHNFNLQLTLAKK
jgi:hypothetical protein